MKIHVLHWAPMPKGARDPMADELRCFISRGDGRMIAIVLGEPEKWSAKGIVLNHVASVDTDDCGNARLAPLDLAYRLTNNIDTPWTENHGVELVPERRYRSTSVGDLMVADGAIYMVTPFGFEQMVDWGDAVVGHVKSLLVSGDGDAESSVQAQPAAQPAMVGEPQS